MGLGLSLAVASIDLGEGGCENCSLAPISCDVIVMPESFILIPGRTSRQGTTLNEGKSTAGYIEEISTLQVAAEDMQRLELEDGDLVRVYNDVGEITVPCKAARGDELPPGLLFISYGDQSSRLMGGDTHGSGMPDSKGLDVFLEPAAAPTAATSSESPE